MYTDESFSWFSRLYKNQDSEERMHQVVSEVTEASAGATAPKQVVFTFF